MASREAPSGPAEPQGHGVQRGGGVGVQELQNGLVAGVAVALPYFLGDFQK